MATIPAGEVRNPQKNMPRALLIATAVVTFTYILIQVVCIGTLPGLGNFDKTACGCGPKIYGHCGRRDYFRRRDHFDYRQFECASAFGSRIPFALRNASSCQRFCSRAPEVLYSLHLDRDYRRGDAGADSQEFICGGLDDQRNRAPSDLRGHVCRVAGFTAQA